MANTFALDSFWGDLTRDQSAERAHELLVRGKVAVASFWPFLAEAGSEVEFEHRTALAQDRIDAVVDPAVRMQVMASLTEDWRTLHTARLSEAHALRVQAAAAQPAQLQPGQEFWHEASKTWKTVVLTREGHLAAIDPSDAWRYNHYPDMNPPVDNGDLQGPGGFVVDPDADNTGMSNQVIQQRQLTPGQWTVTPGTEWPVRPNAGDPTGNPTYASARPDFSQGKHAARHTAGYTNDDLHAIEQRDPNAGETRPTAADHAAHKDWAVKRFGQDAWDHYKRGGWGVNHEAASLNANGHETHPSAVVKGHYVLHNGQWGQVSRIEDDEHGNTHLTIGSGGKRTLKPNETIQAMSPNEMAHRHSMLRQAGEGVIPTPGPNPDYFSQGTNGLQGPPAYPQDPAGEIEPYQNNPLNSGAYAPAPMASSGSEGEENGPYSQANPSASAPTPGPARGPVSTDEGLQGAPYTSARGRLPFSESTHGWPEGDPNDPKAAFLRGHYDAKNGREFADDVDSEHPRAKAYRQGWVEGKGLPTGHYASAQFNDDHVENYIRWAQGEGHDPDHVKTLKRYEQLPGIGRAHTNHIADQLYVGSGDQDWRKSAKTDGTIVGHCDHCNKPVRVHSGDGGPTHLRHLHNNSNRCSDGQTATAARRVTSQFFDPTDPSIVATAAIGDPEDNTGDTTDSLPMGQGFGDTNSPQAADPANPTAMSSLRRRADMDEGMGAEAEMPDEASGGEPPAGHNGGSPDEWAYDHVRSMGARQVTADGINIERPTAENPTGRGSDEFQATHWDNIVRQRPMQQADERNINTPVLPGEPVHTLNTNRPGGEQEEPDEEGINQNEESREASLRSSIAQIMEV